MTRAHQQEVLRRLVNADWAGSAESEHRIGRAHAMQEYLRRMAHWCFALEVTAEWPFLDLAERLDSSVYADDALSAELNEMLSELALWPTVRKSTHYALRWAALKDAGVQGVTEFEDPFEELIRVYELGGGFALEGSFIDLGESSVVQKTWKDYLPLPLVRIDSDEPDPAQTVVPNDWRGSVMSFEVVNPIRGKGKYQALAIEGPEYSSAELLDADVRSAMDWLQDRSISAELVTVPASQWHRGAGVPSWAEFRRSSEWDERFQDTWKTWDEARAVVSLTLPKSVVDRLGEAYRFAAIAHDGQTRPGGEPYVRHLLDVLQVLAQGLLSADEAQLIAGLLHDVVEDTDVTLEQVQDRFGVNVAEMVDWVTIPASPVEDRPAVRIGYLEHLKDAPPLVRQLKLADRYSNVRRLLSHPRAEKQNSYGRETVKYFVPLAMEDTFFGPLFMAWQRRMPLADWLRTGEQMSVSAASEPAGSHPLTPTSAQTISAPSTADRVARMRELTRRVGEVKSRNGGRVPSWVHADGTAAWCFSALDRSSELSASDAVEVVLAAMGHDLLDDTDVTASQIGEQFGEQVRSWIETLSGQPGASQLQRIVEAGEEVRLIKWAALTDNMLAVTYGLHDVGHRWALEQFSPQIEAAREALRGAPFVRLHIAGAYLIGIADVAWDQLQAALKSAEGQDWAVGQSIEEERKVHRERRSGENQTLRELIAEDWQRAREDYERAEQERVRRIWGDQKPFPIPYPENEF
jgi:guanosine-3',5'-bis(diphosphate) 3'-pyrophosphohydrolase